jgi:hypothetical protein
MPVEIGLTSKKDRLKQAIGWPHQAKTNFGLLITWHWTQACHQRTIGDAGYSTRSGKFKLKNCVYAS